MDPRILKEMRERAVQNSDREKELSEKATFTKEEAIEFIRMKIDSEREWLSSLENMIDDKGISYDLINCKFQTLGAIGAYNVALMVIDSIKEENKDV